MSYVDDAVKSRAKAIFSMAFAASLALHGVAYASLGNQASDEPALVTVSTISFEVRPQAKAEPQELRKPTEAPRAASALPDPARPHLARAAAMPTPMPAVTAAAPQPVDLSGVTLTNDTGDGFAMPVGDGNALQGPIGLGGQRVESMRPAPPPVPRATRAPALVAARDLSEHPRPPALEALLRANYPEEARQRGLRGTASVRARIDADGVIRTLRVVAESAAGFGSACRRTVLGSHWSVPRAQNGGAVATEIVYTCHFEVD
ncbi:MAG TPA: TonB family protein [Polyangiaceae bacterium]|jgi:TonB family protein|nr:TonB family protein [Polyangiaceae bacterium]